MRRRWPRRSHRARKRCSRIDVKGVLVFVLGALSGAVLAGWYLGVRPAEPPTQVTLLSRPAPPPPSGARQEQSLPRAAAAHGRPAARSAPASCPPRGLNHGAALRRHSPAPGPDTGHSGRRRYGPAAVGFLQRSPQRPAPRGDRHHGAGARRWLRLRTAGSPSCSRASPAASRSTSSIRAKNSPTTTPTWTSTHRASPRDARSSAAT